MGLHGDGFRGDRNHRLSEADSHAKSMRSYFALGALYAGVGTGAGLALYQSWHELPEKFQLYALGTDSAIILLSVVSFLFANQHRKQSIQWGGSAAWSGGVADHADSMGL